MDKENFDVFYAAAQAVATLKSARAIACVVDAAVRTKETRTALNKICDALKTMESVRNSNLETIYSR
jgi:hypothetical protein